MNEGWCDERLTTRVEDSTCLTYTGSRQNKLEVPRDKDEVNRYHFIMNQQARISSWKKKRKTNGKKKTKWSKEGQG
jgi:hypothetical protein